MSTALTPKRDMLDTFEQRGGRIVTTHTPPGAPRRREAEAFIRNKFAERYDARVSAFAPNLVLFEEGQRIVAATGWRAAGHESLFLERYLDQPIEQIISSLSPPAAQRGNRERSVEVGNLAADKAGGSLFVILNLARHFDRLGFEWVVFTATRELIGIFTRLGLPLLAIAPADPARLGDDAADWGSYYDSAPIVVAGRIRLGIDRKRKGA